MAKTSIPAQISTDLLKQMNIQKELQNIIESKEDNSFKLNEKVTKFDVLLEKECEKYTQMINEYQKIAEAEIVQLKTEKEALQKQAVEKDQMVTRKLLKEKNDLQAEITSKSSEIEGLTFLISEKDQVIKLLQKENEKIVTKFQDEVQILQNDKETLQTRVAELEEENNQLKSNNRLLNATIGDITFENYDLELPEDLGYLSDSDSDDNDNDVKFENIMKPNFVKTEILCNGKNCKHYAKIGEKDGNEYVQIWKNNDNEHGHQNYNCQPHQVLQEENGKKYVQLKIGRRFEKCFFMSGV